ncbi:MAG: flavin reductase family protein [Actinobacteria bacterium]|nr:flavin reductase family protein [Actinomycetota bacterium]
MKKSLGAKTIAYPTPAWAIAAYDSEGKANAMVAAWAGICCSKPPCVAVSLREERYTYAAIVERQAFTVNIASTAQVKELDYLGIRSGARVDKFAATGLTAVKSELVDAPVIEEFPLVLECRVLKTVRIGIHTQFIGEIMDVKADEAVLDGGKVSVDALAPFAYAPETHEYRALGAVVARAFSVGKQIES